MKPANVSELTYPADPVPLGLANRPGEPVLYCSNSREAAIFEAKPEAGDTVAVAHWVTTAPLAFNYVGYSRRVFEALGSNRPVAGWDVQPPPSYGPEQEEIADFLSEAFMRTVPLPGAEDYKKLTAAIAHKLAPGKPFSALLYPSAAMRANADILALKPDFADRHLRLVIVEFLMIDSVGEFSYGVTPVDASRGIDAGGEIAWRVASAPAVGEDDEGAGGAAVGSVLSERYGTVGWQEFLRQKKDVLHDYDAAKEANANRPVRTEHGNVAEARFRQWLSAYLPKKYGVTSGFIIPDVRGINYTLNHYDVIIYDVMNSPMLWASNNPDDREQGRSLAIPAKYVRAVLEVKAAFNKKSIEDAKDKLRELNQCADHLSADYSSGMVFFEARQDELKSCKIAESLWDEEIHGYFGGLILRAEGIDPRVTGYFVLASGASETVASMPLARDAGGLQVDGNGDPLLTQQGDVCNAYSADGAWHFEKGYSPIVEGVHLNWSYNGFPAFFVDLLERLEGAYDPGKVSERGAFGFSFNR